MAFLSVSTSESVSPTSSNLHTVSPATSTDHITHAWTERYNKVAVVQFATPIPEPFASPVGTILPPACTSASHIRNPIHEPNDVVGSCDNPPDCLPHSNIQPEYLVEEITSPAVEETACFLLRPGVHWNAQTAEFEFSETPSYFSDESWNKFNMLPEHGVNVDTGMFIHDVFDTPLLGQDQSTFPPSNTVPALPPTAINPLSCLDCNVTFGRRSERQRHMKKHAEHQFPCTQPGCNKSFYRNDKLTSHLKQRHNIGRI